MPDDTEATATERGLALFAEVYGADLADGLARHMGSGAFGAELARWSTSFSFGTVWSRDGLERRMRSCVVLGMMIALRQSQEIRYHTKMGLANGLTRAEIEEALYTAVPYCGFPAANVAKASMQAAFADLDAAAGTPPAESGRIDREGGMDGSMRVAVVTGASSGIGKEVAKAMAARGWRVIGTGRDPARLAAAESEIRAASTTGAVDMLAADLSLMAVAGRIGREIASRVDRIDLLVNNAGGMARAKAITAEGLEANFAGNHLGPFLLTRALLPLLRATAKEAPPGAVRILNTSSDASEMIPGIDLDDMQNLGRFSPGLAYCTGKLANVLFARALADRFGAEGIAAHAVHPGAVDSNFVNGTPDDSQARDPSLAKVSAAEGADTLIWLATAPEGGVGNGGYWHRRAPRQPNPVVEDAATVARFWAESERLVDAALARTR